VAVINSLLRDIFGGCKNTRLLDIRVFDEATKRAVYKKQTAFAQSEGVSNCPLCAVTEHEATDNRIWKYD